MNYDTFQIIIQRERDGNAFIIKGRVKCNNNKWGVVIYKNYLMNWTDLWASIIKIKQIHKLSCSEAPSVVSISLDQSSLVIKVTYVDEDEDDHDNNNNNIKWINLHIYTRQKCKVCSLRNKYIRTHSLTLYKEKTWIHWIVRVSSSCTTYDIQYTRTSIDNCIWKIQLGQLTSGNSKPEIVKIQKEKSFYIVHK